MTEPLDTAALVDLLAADVGRAMALTGTAPPGLAVTAVRVAVGQRPDDTVPLLPDPLHPERGWVAEVVLVPDLSSTPDGYVAPVSVLLGGAALTVLRGVDNRTAERLQAQGLPDVGALAALPAEALPRLAADGLRLVDAWSRAVLLDRVVAPTGDPALDALPLDRLLTGGAGPLAARTGIEEARRVLLDVAVLAAALDVAVLRLLSLGDLAV